MVCVVVVCNGCLLMADGNLYGFGQNNHRQMFFTGDGSVDASADGVIRILLNKTTSGKGHVAQVDTGSCHSIILADGEWCLLGVDRDSYPCCVERVLFVLCMLAMTSCYFAHVRDALLV